MATSEEDILGATRNDQSAFANKAKVTGTEPAIPSEQWLGRLRIEVIALSHVRACDLNLTKHIATQGLVFFINDTYFAMGNSASQINKTGDVLRQVLKDLFDMILIHAINAHGRACGGEADRE